MLYEVFEIEMRPIAVLFTLIPVKKTSNKREVLALVVAILVKTLSRR